MSVVNHGRRTDETNNCCEWAGRVDSYVKWLTCEESLYVRDTSLYSYQSTVDQRLTWSASVSIRKTERVDGCAVKTESSQGKAHVGSGQLCIIQVLLHAAIQCRLQCLQHHRSMTTANTQQLTASLSSQLSTTHGSMMRKSYDITEQQVGPSRVLRWFHLRRWNPGHVCTSSPGLSMT